MFTRKILVYDKQKKQLKNIENMTVKYYTVHFAKLLIQKARPSERNIKAS